MLDKYPLDIVKQYFAINEKAIVETPRPGFPRGKVWILETNFCNIIKSMSLSYPPKRGSILRCNFHSFREPEMTKMRPVIVLSPPFNVRPNLCTVVACSTKEPKIKMPYHFEYHIDPPLPSPYDSPVQWVKGDMIYTLSLRRLDFFYVKKDGLGQRIYDKRIVPRDILEQILDCVICGLRSNS